MKKYTLTLLVFIIILLFATNPGEEDFKNFISNEIEKISSKGNDVENILGSLFSRPLASIINKTTKVDNYFLFTIYTVKNDVIDAKFLGLFNQFILIKDNSNIKELEDIFD